MLTIENTDQAMKTFENYASWAIEPNTTVLLAGASNDDDTPEVVALEAQIAEMTHHVHRLQEEWTRRPWLLVQCREQAQGSSQDEERR